jgi:hypothetical protein
MFLLFLLFNLAVGHMKHWVLRPMSGKSSTSIVNVGMKPDLFYQSIHIAFSFG